MAAVKAPTATCGCVKGSDGLRDRCEAGEKLWQDLTEARDLMQAGDPMRRGHKSRINDFAAKREAYHEHIGRAS